jgi:hypothetical protein
LATISSDILKKAPCGENSPDLIYHRVGMALTRWEHLQIRLPHTFCTVARCASNFAVTRAFAYNMTVSVKLDMIEQAAEVTLERHALFKQLRAALNRVRGFNERRNDIAHGTVGIAATTVRGKHFFLMPSLTTTKKVKLPYDANVPLVRSAAPLAADYCWNSAQIDRYIEGFDQATVDVIQITNAITVHFT